MAGPANGELRAYALKLAGWLCELLGAEIPSNTFIDIFMFNALRVGASNYEDLGSLVLLECKAELSGKKKIEEQELRRIVNRIQHRIARTAKKEISGIGLADRVITQEVQSNRLEKSDERAELQKLMVGLEHIDTTNLMLVYLLSQGEDHNTIPKMLGISQSAFYNRKQEIKSALSAKGQVRQPLDMKADKALVIRNSEPIRLMDIAKSEVGRVRTGPTGERALYRIPVRLSRRPSAAWVSRFVQVWDNLPRSSTLHRSPGIASVVGDRIVLDETTLEDVEKYDKEVLERVIEQVNKDVNG